MLVGSVEKFLPCGSSSSRGGNSCFAFLVAKYWVVFGMSCEWRYRGLGGRCDLVVVVWDRGWFVFYPIDGWYGRGCLPLWSRVAGCVFA